MKKIKVLVIDDSAVVREILTKGLSRDSRIEVVGKAPDPYIARDKIVFLKPDVLTLDIEMPKMDGLEFLKKLMPQYPLPTIVVSSLTKHGSDLTLNALEAGAVDYVLKPDQKIGLGLNEMMKELIEKVKLAAAVDVSHYKKNRKDLVKEHVVTSKVLKGTTDKVIAIGASTGGTVALRKLISAFPANMPGIVIVQHMPPVFTKHFADSLNKISKMEVKEAENGDRVIAGRVLIAPGDYHMSVYRSGGNYIVKCKSGEKVNGHCPSVDVLFNSVAENVGSNALGLILTGMGRDGAAGLLKMRNSGARTLAQDEASSVVFGMPKEAFQCGGAEKLVPLNQAGNELIELISMIEEKAS
ncbi:MAG: chemotaxis response regulator protein-glutamate methylesterase [Spirochaetes bacterium]|nr:chemotaxis response regulator protein-glutamate methylesterase [Spirochaetota bacterium]